MGAGPEGRKRQLRANDRDLWKSINTSTFTCTVFTIVVLDDKEIECIIYIIINYLHDAAGMAELADAADSKADASYLISLSK